MCQQKTEAKQKESSGRFWAFVSHQPQRSVMYVVRKGTVLTTKDLIAGSPEVCCLGRTVVKFISVGSQDQPEGHMSSSENHTPPGLPHKQCVRQSRHYTDNNGILARCKIKYMGVCKRLKRPHSSATGVVQVVLRLKGP